MHFTIGCHSSHSTLAGGPSLFKADNLCGLNKLAEFGKYNTVVETETMNYFIRLDKFYLLLAQIKAAMRITLKKNYYARLVAFLSILVFLY